MSSLTDIYHGRSLQKKHLHFNYDNDIMMQITNEYISNYDNNIMMQITNEDISKYDSDIIMQITNKDISKL